MRALALHRDVLLVRSALLQLNCVLVRGAGGEAGTEAFLIDSPVLPEELDSLPALVDQAGFPAPDALLATHGDWDHLLGGLAFPGLALGCAQSTARRLQAAPGEAQRELRAFDEELAIERPRPLSLASLQVLPVPGRCGIGAQELELHETAGHTSDGMAIAIPWAHVLVVGDYLSPIEIPTVRTRGGIDEYMATLESLRAQLGEVEHVVPGHGAHVSGKRALELLEEDLAYLRSLRERVPRPHLPPGRDGRWQRRLHEANLAAGA